MDWQFSVYLIPLVLAGAIAAGLAVKAYGKRTERTAPQTVGILAGAAVWAFADAARVAAVDLSWKLLFHDLRFLGSTLIVLATLLFALEYTNRERWMRRPLVAAYAIPFVVTLALVATSQPLGHGLIRSGVDLVEKGGMVLADFRFGPWFYVNAAYSYLLLLVVFVLYVIELLRGAAGTYRQQTLTVSVSLLIPWVLNGLYLADVTLVDLTAVGLTATGAAYYVAIFWFDLFTLVPIARSTLIDHVEHGVIVLDPNRHIVDVNEAMVSMLGIPRAELLGTDVREVTAEVPKLVAVIAEGSETDDLSVEVDGERRHYEVETTPVYSDLDRHLGRLALIRDVTERRRRREALRERTAQLERRNEQLERFANVVSHDLRNPINTAKGYLDLADRDPDPAHLEKVETALDRMEEIIQDVLALARGARAIDSLESVELAATVEEAWGTVETADATLVVRTDRRLDAERTRVQQLLENLFRNAVEHGASDVTVTVGDTPDGFFVEDDGPGIPEGERGEVFTYGYTTDPEGTGFGLSIVAAIAEAHGWSIRTTEGSTGGARFEITDVDPADGVGRSRPSSDAAF